MTISDFQNLSGWAMGMSPDMMFMGTHVGMMHPKDGIKGCIVDNPHVSILYGRGCIRGASGALACEKGRVFDCKVVS